MNCEKVTEQCVKFIHDKVTELNRKNNLLRAKYENDAKYARLHKRIMERHTILNRETEIFDTLSDIKKQADERVLINTKMLDNEGYFGQLMIQLVVGSFDKMKVKLEPNSAHYINNLLVKEYMGEYQGAQAW